MRTKLARRLKDRRGFTLIELMMVVAVIIILAAVLIPRIGTARKEAKYTGVVQNLNTVQAYVETAYARYQTAGDETTPDTLIFKVNALVEDSENKLKNPYTGADGMARHTPANDVAVVWHKSTQDPPDNPGQNDIPPNPNSSYAGCIFVYAKINSDTGDKVKAVYLYPYDGDGNLLTAERRVVK